MIKEKIKNIHYLEMYSAIKDNFNSAVEYSDNDNIYGFIYLKTVVKDICNELISLDGTIVNNNIKDNIAILEYKGVLNYEQVTLFSSILDIADKYAHGSENTERRKSDLESLKNFCIRLDKQLPSLMANLGIGGNSRNAYINKDRFKKRTDIVKKNVNPVVKPNVTLSQKIERKKRNKKILLTSIISLIVIALIYGAMWIKNNNINVIEYITNGGRNLINEVIPNTNIDITSKIKENIKVIGLNGQGYLDYSSSDEILLYNDEKMNIYLENADIIVHDLKTNSRYSYEIEASNSDGLSNGDVISLTIPQDLNKLLENYNISLSSNSINKTIDNLLDLQAIIDDKESIKATIEDYARRLGESNTNGDLKWTGTAEKIYLIPSSISNNHSVVAYLCMKKTFYNWIVGTYQYQYFIDKYVFEADYTDKLNIHFNNRTVSELSNWSSEYNYSKITEDFNIFYKDMDPITIK